MSDMGPDFIEVGLRLTYEDDPAEWQAAADRIGERFRAGGAKAGQNFGDGLSGAAKDSFKRAQEEWTRGMEQGMKLILNAQKAGLERLAAQQEAANYKEQQATERKFERQRIAQEGGWAKRLEIEKSRLRQEEILTRSGENQTYEATRQANRLTMESVKNANATKLQEQRLANSRWVVNTQAFEAKQLADLKAHNARVTELYKQGMKAIQTTYTEALRVMRSTWESGLAVINDTVRGFFARRRQEQAEDDDSSVSRLRERFTRENAITRAGMAEQTALMARGRSVGGAAAAVGGSGLAADAQAAEGPWERLRSKVSGVQVAVALVAASGVMFVKSTLDTTATIGADVIKIARLTGESAKNSSDLRFAFQQSGIEIDKGAKALVFFSKALVAGKVDGIADGGKSLKAQATAIKEQATAQDAVNKAQQKYNDLLTVQAGKKQLTASDLIARRNATDAITAAQEKLNSITVPAVSTATKYGIVVRDLNGKLLPMPEILKNVADKFHSMPNGIEKTALAADLFGRRAGPDMEKLLNRGSAGLQRLYDDAHKFGLELTGANADAIAKHITASRRWTAAWQGIQFQIGLHVLPILTALTTFLTRNMMPAFDTLSWWFNSTFGPVLRVVTALWEKVVDVAERLWTKLSAYPAVVNGVLTFLKGTAIALGLIIAGAGAVKVIEMLQLAFKAMAESELARTVGVLAVLGGVLYTIVQMNPQIGKFFGALVDGFKGWFEVGRELDKPIEGLSNLVLLQSTIGALVGSIVDNIGFLKGVVILLFRGDFARADTYLAEWWNRIAAVLAPMGDQIKGWVLNAVDAASGFVSDLFTALLGGNVGADGNKMAATIGATIRQYVLAAINWVWTNASDLYSGWTNGLVGIVSQAGGADNSVAAKIGDKLHDWISTGISTAWSGITSFWSGLFGGAGDNAAASGIGQQIGSAISSALSSVGKAGAAIGGALLDAISTAWAWVSSHVDFTQILPMVEKGVQWLGYQIGRIVGSKQFIEVLGSIALAMGGLAADIAGHFVLGLVEGLWNRRGDIGNVVSHILDLAFSNPITGIATALALVFTGAKVVGGIMTLVGHAKELLQNLAWAKAALVEQGTITGATGFGSGIADMANKVTFLRDGWDKVKTKIDAMPESVQKIGAAVGIAAGGIGGYMVSQADNAAASIRGIATAAVGVATAFAMGGPIAGGIALVTTAVGFLWGEFQNQGNTATMEVAQRAKATAAAVADYAKSQANDFFNAYNKGGTSLEQTKAVITDAFASDPTVRKTLQEYGTNINDLTIAMDKGGKAWSTYVDQLADRKLTGILNQQTAGLGKWKDAIKVAGDTVHDWANQHGGGLTDYIDKVTKEIEQGKIPAKDFVAELNKVFGSGLNPDMAKQAFQVYKDSIKGGITANQDFAKTFDGLKAARGLGLIGEKQYQDAVDETKRKQEAAAEAAKPISQRISEGWDRIRDAIQQAKDNLDKWYAAQNQKPLTEAQSNIAVDDAKKQIATLFSQTQPTVGSDGTVTPAAIGLREFNDQLVVLEDHLHGDLSERVTTIFRDANGDMPLALTNLKALRDQMVNDLLPAFNGNRDAAQQFVDKVTAVPPDPYAQLNIATVNAKAYQDLLNGSLLITLGALNQIANLRLATGSKDAANRAGLALLGMAKGGFTPDRATPVIVHPNEVVLPLGDKMRMKELLGQRGLGQMVAAAMPATVDWNLPSVDMGGESFTPLNTGGTLQPVAQHTETNHFTIVEATNPHQTAVEVQRVRRASAWLHGGRR